MSVVPFRDIPSWPETPDEAFEIDSDGGARPIFVTEAAIDEDGVPVYLENWVFNIHKGTPLKTPMPDGEGRDYLILTGTVLEALESQADELQDYQVFQAAWPYHINCYASAKFQMGSCNPNRPSAKLIKAWKKDPRLLDEALQRYDRNPLVPDGRCCAVFVFPSPVDDDRSSFSGRNHFATREIFYGMSRQGKQVKDTLRNSPLCLDLIHQTVEGAVLLKYYAAVIALQGQSPDLAENPPPNYFLFPEVANVVFAQKALELAIDLSLAGPKSFKEFDPSGDGRKRIEIQVRNIYLEQIYNKQRRAFSSRYPKGRRKGKVVVTDLNDPEEAFWAQIEKSRSEADVSWDLLKQFDGGLFEVSGEADGDFRYCWLAAVYLSEYPDCEGDAEREGILKFELGEIDLECSRWILQKFFK